MSEKSLINATSDNESGVVSSLSEIKARLAARRERDLTKLETHSHEALGAVYIAFLPTEGYHAIEAAEMPQEAWGIGTDNVWKPEDIQKNIDDKRDRAYLKYGVITGDNKRLDEEVIGLLLSGDYGAENRRLINAIKAKNPPREYLVQEVEKTFVYNQWTCVLIELLIKAGYLKQMRDYLLADPESAEFKVLSADFQKWEDVLPEMKAFMNVDEFKERIGIGKDKETE